MELSSGFSKRDEPQHHFCPQAPLEYKWHSWKAFNFKNVECAPKVLDPQRKTETSLSIRTPVHKYWIHPPIAIELLHVEHGQTSRRYLTGVEKEIMSHQNYLYLVPGVSFVFFLSTRRQKYNVVRAWWVHCCITDMNYPPKRRDPSVPCFVCLQPIVIYMTKRDRERA